jgi:hypothetical protein
MRNYRIIYLVFCALMPLLAGTVLYALLGHRTISAMYHGEVPCLFRGVIEQQRHVPLEAYVENADSWFILASIYYAMVAGVSLALWLGRENVIVRRLSTICLDVCEHGSQSQ